MNNGHYTIHLDSKLMELTNRENQLRAELDNTEEQDSRYHELKDEINDVRWDIGWWIGTIIHQTPF